MARKAVVDAVEARLTALWTECPVIGMNTVGEPPADGSDYLLVQYPVADDERIAVNQGLYRETGGIRFVLHMQRGFGIAAALARSEALTALFRDQSFGGVITQTPSSAFLDNSNEDGNYLVLSLVVPFTHNYV